MQRVEQVVVQTGQLVEEGLQDEGVRARDGGAVVRLVGAGEGPVEQVGKCEEGGGRGLVQEEEGGDELVGVLVVLMKEMMFVDQDRVVCDARHRDRSTVYGGRPEHPGT